MKDCLSLIQQYIDSPYNPLQFSLDLEYYLWKNFEQMRTDDEALTDELNENFPDICATCEPGYDIKVYYDMVIKETKRIERILNRKLFDYNDNVK